MSFTRIDPRPPRLHRSELAVPGSNPALFEKAARSAADVVFLDLEDAVAPDEKERARRNVIAALNEIDWGTRSVSVRINGLDTHYMYRDVIEVAEACPRLDLLLVPKIGTAADVYALDMLLTQIEQATGRTKRVGLELQIETALGLANVEAIAAASLRAEALCFGSGDLAASLQAKNTIIGGIHPDYGVLTERGADGRRQFVPGDQWHAVQSRIVTAARAWGLRPIDGPYSDFRDAEGFSVAARRSAAIGFEGKMVIHPSQIAEANVIFAPSPEDVARAQRIVQAMEEATRAGKGAIQLDGRMVDIANIRMAEHVLAKARAIKA
jgi:malyl-CoA/(S)-citramalyl-CoA lyase